MSTNTISPMEIQLSKNGLTIQRENQTLQIRRIYTLRLLQKLGYINSFHAERGHYMVCFDWIQDWVDHLGYHSQKVGRSTIQWEAFVMNFTIDEVVASEIYKYYLSTIII